ncbi:MAG: PorV/PorQ family protein [Endomicrobiia bacterium]
MKVFKIFIFLLLFSNALLFGAGTDPTSFLNFGTGGRAFAMAGAYSGIAEDATASYYNSGALGILQYKELMASHSILWLDTSYSFIGYAHPILDKGVLGFNVVRLYSGGAERRDENNVPQGNFDHSKTALNVGYGKELFRNIYIGVNGKVINSVLDTSSLYYLSCDVGGYYKINHVLSLGVNFQNVIPLVIGETDDKLPLNFRFGVGYKVFGERLLVSVDLNKNSGESENIIDTYCVGFESRLLKFLNLRFGRNPQEMTAGIGFNYKLYNFDYAIAMHEYLGPSHRASFGLKFGKNLDEIRSERKKLEEEKPIEVAFATTPEQENKEEKFKALYQEAVQDYTNGMFMVSLEKFKKALEIFPDDSLIPLYIQRLQIVTKIIPQHISPGKVGDLIRRGVTYFVEGNGENSVKTIAYALSLEPENFTMERLLNRIEEQTGIKAEKTTPMTGLTIVDQKLYECLIHFRKKDFWKVVKLCEEILILEPNNVEAYKRMGSAFYSLGEKEKAKELWKKALSIKPDKKLEEFIRKIK